MAWKRRKFLLPGKPLKTVPRPADVMRLLGKCVETWIHTHDPMKPWTASPCWIWQGGKDDNGYGFIKWRNRKESAHRVAYQVFRGPLPDGQQADHLCFEPGCCNPWHMTSASHEWNSKRQKNSRHVVEIEKRHVRSDVRELVGVGDDVAPF